LALVSQVRTYHYQGCLDGSQNRGRIMVMMDIRSAVKIQENTMDLHLQLGMSLDVASILEQVLLSLQKTETI
jgi:hypothetical protein